MDETYQSSQSVVQTEAGAISSRERFLVRTYNHLFVAIFAFTLLEIALFKTGLAAVIASGLLSVNWLFVLGGFAIVGCLASGVAHSSESRRMQYLALVGYVVAEAIIFVPLLYIANYAAPGTIQTAATITLIGFAGLTGIAFWTRRDFSFLGGMIRWAMVLALVAIAGGAIFGFSLGTWFSVVMVGLSGAAILYDTSKILHEFPEDRHVGAALELFASVALMFWYVLRLFLSSDED